MSADYRHCYIHVPFCARRCSYCDFAIAVRKEVPWREFNAALEREWAARNVSLVSPLRTLYLGGGTPSLLGTQGVQQLMDWVRTVATLERDAEITLEANPEDISEQSVAAWYRAGINRLSIGVQSFDENVLGWMHRVHDSSAALRAVQVARDGGIPAYSIDLIFALPESLNRDWNRDLEIALSLRPDHISLYGLTVEPRTPLGKWESRGEVVATSEERYEEQFLLANRLLTSAGFEHYEVSNFGRPGKRAVHNSAYWSGAPYLGLGPSAHGFDGETRRWNQPVYTRWRAVADAGGDPVEGSEHLDAGNRLTERVYLGLRTCDGLLIEETDRPLIDPWLAAGWLEPVPKSVSVAPDAGSEPVPKSASGSVPARVPARVRCTPLGWLRLDALASALTSLRSR